eukprot:jgi/Ulvmu1/4653/UM002_0384.1
MAPHSESSRVANASIYQRLRAPLVNTLAPPTCSIRAESATNIKLICTDVDGTLLNSQQQLTDNVAQTIQQAYTDLGIPTVVATGKARGPWIHDVLPQLPPMPGVFMQGLLVHEAGGTLVSERWLPDAVIAQCISLAQEHGLTLTAYCGERIVTDATNAHTDRLLFYREPIPEAVGCLRSAVLGAGSLRVHKLLFMEDDVRIQETRSLIEEAVQQEASVTSALAGMLEVLPQGASKATGVQVVLETLEIKPEEVMALGDAENDLEMLQMAGVSVAMGNASDQVKRVTSYTAPTNDEDGVAVAITKFLNL